jgi:hypothetical protein
VASVEELVEEYKGKLVFKPNVQWPSIYHFRLLAFTHRWRTAENQRMVAEVVKRLCLARLGMINMIPELRRQVGILVDMLDADNGCFTKKLTHFYFSKWGGDPGLMLETNWRAPERRVYDLTFRCLLIWHYAEDRVA